MLIENIELNNLESITDNTKELNENRAFFLTNQNKQYLDQAKKLSANIINTKELKELFKIDDNIKIVGITGTNGKTTTAAALYSFLLDLGEKAALLGTRGFFINDEKIEEKGLTTPPTLSIYYNLYRAIQNQCKYFIMEVSSHAIDQDRIEDLQFALKIFTNITQDHLDYHKTFEEYKRVKGSFFSDETLKLINKDATQINFNIKNCYTYALDNPASFNVIAYTQRGGTSVALQHFDKIVDFYSPLQGVFNIYNLVAAVGGVKLLTNHSLEDICEVVNNFAGVSGRMEIVSEDPLIIVDFAHTPDGMEKVLDSFKDMDVSVVFGAGGDRDKEKRALMGKVANRYAKKIYITSDNPRNEKPIDIIKDIYNGIDNCSKIAIEEDRKSAIRLAIENMQNNEVLLILGKGDEEYQEINGKKIPFDDRVVAKTILQEKINQ